MTETIEKTCHPNAFRTQDQSHFVHQSYAIVMQPGIAFADLFAPGFWVHARQRNLLKVHDLVRCIGQSNEFDVVLAVVATPAGGVVMRFLYGDPGTHIDDPYVAAVEARKMAQVVRVVPLDAKGRPKVRTQFLPATNWRFLGIDGQEVDRGFENEPAAAKAMDTYLRQINMRMPTDDEIALAIKEAETKTPATA